MQSMQSLTLSLGFLLIILGLAAYFGTDMASVTALIPAFFGVFFVTFGQIAKNEKYRKNMMHAAAGLAILGALGAARGIPGLIAIIKGGEVTSVIAVYGQVAMFLMCLVYVLRAVQSFRKARTGSGEDS